MAKKKFTFTHADGRVEKRSSDRTYTHVVLLALDLAAMRRDCETYGGTKFDRDGYEYMVSRAAAGDAPNYVKQLAGTTSYEEYVAARRVRMLADIDKKYGTGAVSAEVVRQWSMSEKNARKAKFSDRFVATVRVAQVDAADDDLNGWVPEADPNAWMARDAALIAAARARRA